eukprot:3689698-Amphidinium_carterae.1
MLVWEVSDGTETAPVRVTFLGLCSARSRRVSGRRSSGLAFNMDAHQHDVLGRVFIPYLLHLGSSAGTAVHQLLQCVPARASRKMKWVYKLGLTSDGEGVA